MVYIGICWTVFEQRVWSSPLYTVRHIIHRCNDTNTDGIWIWRITFTVGTITICLIDIPYTLELLNAFIIIRPCGDLIFGGSCCFRWCRIMALANVAPSKKLKLICIVCWSIVMIMIFYLSTFDPFLFETRKCPDRKDKFANKYIVNRPIKATGSLLWLYIYVYVDVDAFSRNKHCDWIADRESA